MQHQMSLAIRSNAAIFAPSLFQPGNDDGQDGPEDQARLLAAIVRDSNDAIISKRLDGTITSWNLGAERLFGYTSDEAVGRHITMIIPDDRLAEEDVILGRLRAGERLEHFETIRQHKDGERIDVSLTVSPIRSREGKVIGASKVARDIRDRKRYEAVLREADHKKEEFLAILSHELRGPLAPLLGTADLLRRASATEVEWIANILERQVRQMTRLVDDLLDISKINAGKLSIDKAPVDLAEVVDAAVQENQRLLDAFRLQIEIVRPPAPVVVNGDRQRLVQVMSNLLNNAAKYTDPRGRITVSLSHSRQRATVSVRDTGIGMSAERLNKIFGMYVQADDARKRALGGFGVGLTVTQRLVELHGGTITAQSGGAGQGSEFTVQLPLHPAALNSA